MSTICVIVPFCNAEDTPARCIGNILTQTQRNLNIILIDDGSTDISSTMCNAYTEFDTRVQTFHTPNRGPSAARNLGLDHVQKKVLVSSPLPTLMTDSSLTCPKTALRFGIVGGRYSPMWNSK